MNVAVARKGSYPDSDGTSIADNTLHFEWVSILKWGAEARFADDPDVFVAGAHMIYPVEGKDTIRVTPDVYVAFDRPKGHRGNYKVFIEEGVFPQVIFEVWSQKDTYAEMQEKHNLYEKHGAEEYYVIYPTFPTFVEAWKREGGRLVPLSNVHEFVSPRLGFRFYHQNGVLKVFAPDYALGPDQTGAGVYCTDAPSG